MAETNQLSKAAESSKFTGKIKWLDSLGFGYIVSDNPFLSEVSVSPSSYSSNFIKEGDCVKFNINICGSNPRNSFEAINVTPYINAKCCCCHTFGHELINCPQLGVSNDKCFHCGLIGHVSKDCDQKLRDLLSNKKPHRRIGNVGGGFGNGCGGGVKVGCASESIVCVKSKEDVKKVEEVEDCFILEFDPTLDDDDYDVKFIVCVKKMEDVKKIEEVEDCFILEFDPFELDKFSNLSLYEKPKIKIEEDDDVVILAEKGKVACRDYPHPRHLCATHPFRKTPHELYCKMCYCYICDIPAPCNKWNKGFKIQGLNHCDAEFVIVKDASES